MSKTKTVIEEDTPLQLTLTGIYFSEERSTGLAEGVEKFRIMLGELDITDKVSDREHQMLYNVMLDELRG